MANEFEADELDKNALESEARLAKLTSDYQWLENKDRIAGIESPKTKLHVKSPDQLENEAYLQWDRLMYHQDSWGNPWGDAWYACVDRDTEAERKAML